MRELIEARPQELELNTSKGWAGASLAFLHDLNWLKALTVIDMKIADVSPVSSLSLLERLKLVTYSKVPIDLSKLCQLNSLSIEWIRGAESLFLLPRLQRLFINRYPGHNAEPFSKLKNLRSLAILNSPMHDLSGLRSLADLRELTIAGLRKLDSLSGVDSLTRLEIFEMQNCKSVNKLDELSKLYELSVVNISSNGNIKSLKPISRLPKLKKILFYESTYIEDGDLDELFENENIEAIFFQNRRHYSKKREQFRAAMRPQVG